MHFSMYKSWLSLLTAALFCFSSAIHAQNSITGKISHDGIPLRGVSVYIPDLKTGAATAADGSYRIQDIPAGTYLMEISMIGYAKQWEVVVARGVVTRNYALIASGTTMEDVVVTGVPSATLNQKTPVIITTMGYADILENTSTNVIDAIAKEPGVSAMTDGQSISKPVIRGLGYNRVLTVNDGVEQVDQAWFDEFGIETDPDAVHKYEILKGPASLAYGSDAIAGVVNLIPEDPLPEGQTKGGGDSATLRLYQWRPDQDLHDGSPWSSIAAQPIHRGEPTRWARF